MQSNNSKSTQPSLAAAQLLVRSALIGGLAIVVLILAVLTFQHIKSKSYARLVPMGVMIELTYVNPLKPRNEVILEYDYGYGYIPAHRQFQVIKSRPEPSVIEFSVSSWKPTRALRLSVEDEQGVVPHAVTFTKLGESRRVLLSSTESGVLLNIEDVATLFSQTLIPTSESKVN
ncbi:MAG: hypothetical protein ACI9XU_001640 [Arenicella sp.]|jgi:hypothetical protein